ncbi:biotin synthase BioB [Paucibacter sp. KCTC 42545]|uniref:biotin synthase BioB n=1 Tax=Paucibacter sp. KCTC 42545 TaxID=1768242 RepID=UPI000733C2C4|nr:radical SAM protein [Paucibacter sp. KCTC 42545]ALT79270.1 hypothetical protein AT984_20800 [Paucibacter sp. KCTC 42545]
MTNQRALIEALRARGTEQQNLFAAARQARKLSSGDAITLRGVIEVTNVCRVNCDYCPMRRENTRQNERFQLSEDDIVEMGAAIVAAGIRVILIQGGETTTLLAVVEAAVRRLMKFHGPKLEIIVNLGNFTSNQYHRLRDAGVSSYILKHETSNPELFRQLRHESLEERLRCLHDLKSLGFKVGTGLISSLPGQSLESIAEDIRLAGRLGVDMCSVSPFIPAPNTPMEHVPNGDNDLALNAIACLRILYPNILIPSVSALERTSVGGQSRGLDAGANVLTVNFTKLEHQRKYLIYGKDRFVVTTSHVQKIVADAGLHLEHSIDATLAA